MSSVLTKTADPVDRPGNTEIKSIVLTANNTGLAILKIYRYKDTTSEPIITVKAAQDTTVQLAFDGVVFPDGVTVDSVQNVDSFLIEYVR